MTKLDFTGEKIGLLTVLGKGDKIPRMKSSGQQSFRQLWRLQCDCGNIIQRCRSDFERSKQPSCGCVRKSGRHPKDILGQRFGTLTAITLTGEKYHSKPTWLMQCDCGNTRKMCLTTIRQCQREHIRINCGDRKRHPERWLQYPPIPNPYPKEAGELLVKYLALCELPYQRIDSHVEDEKRDRLFRAAWIITYRRSIGETISESHERRIILKYLRYCSIIVFWKRKLEQYGGLLYNVNGKRIGSTMTDLTLNDYPVIETQGIKILPIQPSKRISFKRY